MDILTTFESYAAYVRGLRNYSQVTVKCRRGAVRFFVAQTGIRNLCGVSEEAAREFLLQGRIKRGWSVATFLTYLKHLNVFFAWGVEHGYANANPFAGMEKPRLQNTLPRRLTCEEAERLLQACPQLHYRNRFRQLRSQAVIAMMLYTGLRRAEILNLRREHVDLQTGVLCVVQGKGGKDRNLPINSRLSGILETYMAERQTCGVSNPYFFNSVLGDRPLSERELRRLIERLKVHTGLNFSSHALRHTFATLMLEGGCDIYSLSRMMGHSKITTTTIYLSASTKLLARSIEKHPLGCGKGNELMVI